MILSLPVVLLFGVLMILLIRKGGMKISHALVAAFFGFYLASTSIAGSIRNSTDSVASFISGLHF